VVLNPFPYAAEPGPRARRLGAGLGRGRLPGQVVRGGDGDGAVPRTAAQLEPDGDVGSVLAGVGQQLLDDAEGRLGDVRVGLRAVVEEHGGDERHACGDGLVDEVPDVAEGLGRGRDVGVTGVAQQAQQAVQLGDRPGSRLLDDLCGLLDLRGRARVDGAVRHGRGGRVGHRLERVRVDRQDRQVVTEPVVDLPGEALPLGLPRHLVGEHPDLSAAVLDLLGDGGELGPSPEPEAEAEEAGDQGEPDDRAQPPRGAGVDPEEQAGPERLRGQVRADVEPDPHDRRHRDERPDLRRPLAGTQLGDRHQADEGNGRPELEGHRTRNTGEREVDGVTVAPDDRDRQGRPGERDEGCEAAQAGRGRPREAGRVVGPRVEALRGERDVDQREKAESGRAQRAQPAIQHVACREGT
jgi:hypothetical protein